MTLVALVVALALAPQPGARAQAGAADTNDDIESLQADQQEVERLTDEANAELADITGRIDVLEGQVAEATARMTVLDERVAVLQARVDATDERLLALQERIDAGHQAMRDRARSLYMHGPSSPLTELLTNHELDEAIDRASMLDRLSRSDQAIIETAQADAANLEAAVQETHMARAELVTAQREAGDVHDELDDDLAEAQRLQDEVEDRVGELSVREQELADDIEAAREALRQRKAANEAAAAAAAAEPAESSTTSATSASPGATASVASSGRACPMNGVPQLFNDWGAPRGGGSRSHKGNDLYGNLGEPVYAMVSGVWDVQSRGNSAGIWGILRGDDGNEYWYMHLDAHVVGDGARVSVGQQVATNGWTGNARGGVYHVHFEVHAGGGGAVDPYPYLVGVC